jgi:lysozyme
MDEQELRSVLEDFIRQLQAILLEIKEEEQETELHLDGELDHQMLLELASHEGIVLEAYKDSVGVWTWGIGVTNASGHNVDRYRDNPQTVKKVIEIFEWLVRTKYLPAVKKAFTRPLTREQLAAALSFHYNTGAIGRASWVKSFNQGKLAQARREILNWRTPSEILSRRKKEQALFFDGKWSNDGTVTVFPVNKPSYRPAFSKGKKIQFIKELT